MSLHGPSKSELMALREKEDKAEKIVVSPDEGGVKRAKSVADKLGLDIAIIYQRKGKGLDGASLVGNVEGKVAIVIDDMVFFGSLTN
jgi:ribose-phosphate pyrophosphokinase